MTFGPQMSFTMTPDFWPVITSVRYMNGHLYSIPLSGSKKNVAGSHEILNLSASHSKTQRKGK